MNSKHIFLTLLIDPHNINNIFQGHGTNPHDWIFVMDLISGSPSYIQNWPDATLLDLNIIGARRELLHDSKQDYDCKLDRLGWKFKSRRNTQWWHATCIACVRRTFPRFLCVSVWRDFRAQLVRILVFPSPTGHLLWSVAFPLLIWGILHTLL